MLFSVIISEKGGAERREAFDRAEINVGRVQGNELMLPKGNVSKRHARLIYRDGRFIVTDLKSTNGTYVNGRKIAQATIVREGDKIYVGDFVLRIEAGPSAQPPRIPSGEFGAAMGADIGNIEPPLSSAGPASVSQGKPAPSGLTGEQNAQEGSLFPGEIEAEEPAHVPAPPRVPRAPHPTKPSQSMLSPTALSSMPPTTTAPPPLAPLPPNTRSPHTSSIPAPPQSPFPPPVFTGQKNSSPPVALLDRGSTDPNGVGPTAAHRAALVTLVERVGESVDLRVLTAGDPPDSLLAARLLAVLQERASAMKIASMLPDGVSLEHLVAEAKRELLEVGPLGPLLADEDVIEARVMGHERVLAFRKSRKAPTSELSFTSEEALARVIRKLAKMSGVAVEESSAMLERRLPDGTKLIAVLPPAGVKSRAVVLRKPQRADASSLEELSRTGTMSRAVTALLASCVLGRANILVTGPAGTFVTTLVASLLSGCGLDERVIVLQDDEEIPIGQTHALSLPLGTAEAAAITRAATRMRPDRLIVGSLSGIAAEIAFAQAEGVGNVIAAARSATLRQALAKLAAEIAVSRPGMSPEAAKECLAATFDLALEVGRTKDGRARLLRVAELRYEGLALVTKDIFLFSVERTAASGAVEGALYPTGNVPAIVEDLSLRGVSVDPGLFRRTVLK